MIVNAKNINKDAKKQREDVKIWFLRCNVTQNIQLKYKVSNINVLAQSNMKRALIKTITGRQLEMNEMAFLYIKENHWTVFFFQMGGGRGQGKWEGGVSFFLFLLDWLDWVDRFFKIRNLEKSFSLERVFNRNNILICLIRY